ncbi:MAG TPA: ATP-grasp domain-containing protein [Nitrososphaera sp.]|nr:ATP-grasp domain-containing protein [Nitrososphaera sp.]
MNASVLVTSGGSIVAQGIIKSLKIAGKGKYTMIAADTSPLAAGLYRCEKGVLVPPASSVVDYVESIIRVCNDNDVSAIFCGSDDELLVLANARDEIERRTGAKLLTGSTAALTIARDKWYTYKFCKEKGLACAPSSLPEGREEFVKEFGFPLVVKPREGYGSIHFYVANNREEMDAAISTIEKAGWRPLLQKYLSGEEFTTGVTIDKNARYAMSSISIKKVIRHGQTYKAFIDDYYTIRRIAEEVALQLRTCGPINVQARLEGDSPVIIEINPRFSATCPMRAVAGVNEPDIVFRNLVLGEEVKVDSYERLVCLRYWNEVYVPYTIYEEAERGIIEKGSFVPDYF